MITASCVGTFGRWGNSLFQYAFARWYAESIGAELRIPLEWEGRRFFSTVNEAVMTAPAGPRVAFPTGQDNIDLHGYFQSEQHVSKLSRSKLKEWLQPFMTKFIDIPKIAVHTRRSDYIGNGYYAVVTDDSYKRAVEQFGYDWKDVKIYRCDSPTDQYMDFLEIMMAPVIFRSNSTFSWWAATLSNAKVYSPVVGDATGEHDFPFVEGNHPKLCQLFSDLHIKE